MASIRLDSGIESRLNRLSEATGRTKSYYVRRLITEDISLDDLEDICLAEHRLEHPIGTMTSAETRKALGLDH